MPRATVTVVPAAQGVEVGVFSGYLATWEPDTGGKFGIPDQFARGAFRESLAEHRARGNRQVRLKFQHDFIIGGFPIELVEEDAKGLRVTGEINLSNSLGRDVWALIEQRVLTDLSIGFLAVDDRVGSDVRTISKAIILEGSVVDEPANRGAVITEVKAVEPVGRPTIAATPLVPATDTSPRHDEAKLAELLADLESVRATLRPPRHDAAAMAAILRDLRATRASLRAA